MSHIRWVFKKSKFSSMLTAPVSVKEERKEREKRKEKREERRERKRRKKKKKKIIIT